MKILLNPDPQGGQSGGGSDWKASLPEDLRGAPVLANVPDVATLVKNYVNAESLIGKKRLPVPDKNWNDGQWDEFYKLAGRPETPDKYKVPEFKFEEGVTVNDEMVDKARLQFHKLGLSEKQAAGVLEHYFGIVNEQFKASKGSTESEKQAAEAALRKEYGDKYEQKVTVANAVLAKFSDQEGSFTKFLAESKLGNDPRMVKFLLKVADKINEDAAGNPGGDLPLPSAARAKMELEQLKSDDDFKKKFLTGDKWAVGKWNELQRLAAQK